MKKYILLVLLITFLLVSCDIIESVDQLQKEKVDDEMNVVQIEGYGIEMEFPSDWDDITNGTQFDLKCTNKNCYFGAFVYYDIDLAKEQTPYDIFEIQNDDLLSRRENIEFIGDDFIEVNGKSIHSMHYYGESDGKKNHYYFNLVEFENKSDKFVWILFTGYPSVAQKQMEEWSKIIYSMRLVEES